MSVKTNEIQIAEKVLALVVSMNQIMNNASNTVLNGFNKLKALTDIPNKKTILEAGLVAKGTTLQDIQDEIIALKNIATYIKNNASTLVEL